MRVVIVGAGPAGLTAAIELQRAGIRDILVIESESQVGGISKTVAYKGNRIDIGGHRFFSKSDWVMNWWADFLPVDHEDDHSGRVLKYQGRERPMPPVVAATESQDSVLLVRQRLSRIYFNRRFFSYPLQLNVTTLRQLGFTQTLAFALSYLASRLTPIRPEISLQDFLINRFGRRLYQQFFQEYTEKVWGVPCSTISAAWGAQRIKSLSIAAACVHALTSVLRLPRSHPPPTSLIESFLYPKYGPGQMWETVASTFTSAGGTITLASTVTAIQVEDGRVQSVTYTDATGRQVTEPCAWLVSTMPVRDLVLSAGSAFSPQAIAIATGLQYRDFITVGLLYDRNDLPHDLRDNWIYIQEPGVKVGRVQVFNNWSPHLVGDPANHVWLGLEFFCSAGDGVWQSTDSELRRIGEQEMYRIGLVSSIASLDATVLRVPKAYPGYFGASFEAFPSLRDELDQIPNLFLIGRNGMHRYNNQDHSMLTAAEAARQIVSGAVDKARIWSINIDDDYHEQR